jgi:hypothetical protein
MDAATSGEDVPKTLGDRVEALGVESGPGVGRAPGQWEQGAQGAIGGHGGTGVLVWAAGGSSRDCPRQTLAYFSAATCVAVTGHDEPGRAYGESEDGKDA